MNHRRELPAFFLRKLAAAVPLLLGVTLISFALTVHFGPDPAHALVGKNPTAAELAQLRQELGQDRPFWIRYADYLRGLATLDLGHAQASGESVRELLGRTLPVSAMLLAPGFLLGTALALALAMWAAWYRGSRLDRWITGCSVVGMSLSFVVIIIGLQAIFGVWLGWFPVRGWAVGDPGSYVRHVSLPTLAFVLASLGYNTRFFRAMLVNAMSADHVRTALAYGATPRRIMIRHVLPAALLPIMTRIIYTVPGLAIAGSLLIESHFAVPGIGRITYQAILAGDQAVIMAVVGLSAVLLALTVTVADMLGQLADPRIRVA
ncbi:ABC transporter permease [Wenzhouxiangella sp. AB-CW3]|uniref:ABC transporter permease n=1 Tax=Wenzhouxiangella sp. AB-CW3 TaxID=2771012 RepID=UPI00168A9721|nr:ABC transporter permease [Wenzhouxiangella sp. AB-CW3]QOC21910.1 ABC transporter permease [Wenzhouxiangella sp. AB-CW3]